MEKMSHISDHTFAALRENPQARFPGYRDRLVVEVDHPLDIDSVCNQHGIDIPGFTHESMWITDPYHSHCGRFTVDPMQYFGFELQLRLGGATPFSPLHRLRLQTDHDIVYLTDAFGTGLPGGMNNWRLWTRVGSIVSHHGHTWVIGKKDFSTCEICHKAVTTGAMEYMVVSPTTTIGQRTLMCPECALTQENDGLLAVVPAVHFDRAMAALDIDAPLFHEGLAGIQDALDQDDGGPASVWFDTAVEREWPEAGARRREAILCEYTAYEFRCRQDRAAEEAEEAEAERRAEAEMERHGTVAQVLSALQNDEVRAAVVGVLQNWENREEAS